MIAALAAAAPARAEAGFTWKAPASCPTAAEVRARIEQRLGDTIEGSVHGIEVVITRQGARFVARVDLRGLTVANDVRTLRATRCDELSNAIAVIIARLATEAGHRRGDTAPEPSLAFLKAPEPAVADPQIALDRDDLAAAPHPVDRPRLARAGHRWGVGVRALGLSGVGAQPGVSVGGELAVHIRRDAYVAELGVATWSATPAVLRHGAPGHVDVGLDVVIARAGWGPERLPLRAWLGVEVGRMHGQGVSLEDPRGGSGRWTAVDSGFAVGWPVADHARVVGMFEIAVPVARASFMLTSGTEAYRPALASARCALGFEIGWP